MRPASAVQWLDLQPFLERMCDQMAVGELLNDESFNLYDSMTAIEIGDPKMDLALRKHQDVGTPEELIAAGHAPIELSAPQLLGLMDQLMVMEAAWHCGAMLPQTVYTSLYMLQIDRLAGHPVLEAFCLAMRTACTTVRDLIINGQVCEDEDFSIYTFGVTLDPPGPGTPSATLQALTDMEEYLQQQVKEGRSAGSRSGGTSGGKKPKKGSAEGMALEATKAMLARILFRKLFHQALQHLNRTTRGDVEAARKCCELAMEELQEMRNSCHLANAAEHPGFVPEINRKHMGLVPPRPVKLVSREEMVDHFSSLMAALRGICDSLLGVHSWDDLQSVLVPFAAQPSSPITRSVIHLLLSNPIKNDAHVAAVAATAKKNTGSPKSPPGGRSPGQGRGSTGGFGFAGTSGGTSSSGGQPQKETVPAWCPTPLMVCGEFGWQLDALPGADAAMFVEQCAIAMQGWCHTMCLNRARQRRRLRHLLEDWRNMFDHGLNADVSAELGGWMTQHGWRWVPLDETGEYPQGPVATWVEREACKSILGHLMLGFQLGLYQPYEYRVVYWYCDYLIGTQQQASKFLASARPPPITQQAQQQRPQRQGRRHKDGGKDTSSDDALVVEQRRTVQFMSLEVERMMCQGMTKLTTGLHMLGCIQEPEAPFNGEEQRFAQRFACLQILARPQPLCYAHYQGSMQTAGLSADSFFALAFENFFKAQHGATALLQGPVSKLLSPEQMNHLTALKRVALQNSMALKIMISTAKSEPEAQAQQQPAQQADQHEQQQQQERQQKQEQQQPPQQQDEVVTGAQQEPVDKQRPQRSLFNVSWDFSPSLQSSASMFYPAVALRSATST